MNITIRTLEKSDLADADRIVRLAFGTFIGLPDPTMFMGDADYVRTRWTADPSAAFGAFAGGELVGSNFATNWGSVGFFGPLTIRPDLWDRGIGKRLLEPVMDKFSAWGIQHAGLYTFPHSQKHAALYQKFGFWPRFLTAVMSKPVTANPNVAPASLDCDSTIDACAEITNPIYEGLDVRREISAVLAQKLGEIIVHPDAFAVCHCGAGSEAGSGVCYIKFAAVRPRPNAEHAFRALLDACESIAARHGLKTITAGVNTARHEAYRTMLSAGFKSTLHGVTMHKPNEAAYSRLGVFVIDDWR